MSHDATNWAIKQRGLKPTTKLVLWHLADRLNPDFGCFPRQDTLAADVEISRSALNEHLAILEEKGLIRRISRIDPKTKRQLSTRYILGCEPEFTPNAAIPCPEVGLGIEGGEDASNGEDSPEPCPENGHGAVSGKSPEPCPENGKSRVRKSDTNPVREPLIKPVRRAGARGGRAGKKLVDHRSPEDPPIGDSEFDAEWFESFWQAYPAPVERNEALRAFGEALSPPEVSPSMLLSAAKAYASSPEVQRGYVMKPANWLDRGAWRDHIKAEAQTIDLNALARQWVDVVIAGQTWAGRAIRPEVARHMLRLKLVTTEQLRAAGVTY